MGLSETDESEPDEPPILAEIRAKYPPKATAMYRAAMEGKKDEVIAGLANGVDVNYKNHEQQTSLYIASVYGEVETIELLLERGADVNALRWDGTSPIFGAATYARIDVLKLLLKAGADLDIFGKCGNHMNKRVYDIAKETKERTELPEKEAAFDMLVAAGATTCPPQPLPGTPIESLKEADAPASSSGEVAAA